MVMIHRGASIVAASALALAVGGCGASPASGARSASPASSVLAWGTDGSGQLGEGDTTQGSLVPVKVKLPAGTKVTAIAAGRGDTLALTSTGSVLAWGYNARGEPGDGSTASSDIPVKVKLPAGTKVTAIAAGDLALAVTSTGSVFAWGNNAHGELGDGKADQSDVPVKKTTQGDIPVKVKLPAGTRVTAVAAGAIHSLAVTSTGSVLAWGYNADGELGDGSTASSDVPVKVKLPAGTKATAVAAGPNHSVALTSTGSVLAWGYNAHGELGDGKTTQSDIPVKVKLPGETKVTAVATGCGHSLAVTSTGSVLAWGYNGHGQLGDGSTGSSDVPVKVKLPARTKATAVATGCVHSLALTSTGSVLAWGYNAGGELGDGKTTAQSDVPVKVKLPAWAKATKLGAGSVDYWSLALVHRG